MNITKKYDRFKQWTDERVGASKGRTEASDEFKNMEIEMGLRYEGLKTNQKAMSNYVKGLNQRIEGDGKEKMTPMLYLGSSMANHGDDFSNDSEFGQCLTMMGRSHERIARAQESYAAKATSTWLESSERSLAQLKEYQSARKKLESRRLAYDAASGKMDRAKKDDFRLEEEARIQKSKYEESNEDVFRRMQDIQEQEAESVRDLTDFLEAELEYHERCREFLLQLRAEWPASSAASRSRPGTRHSNEQRYADNAAPPAPADIRPSIRSKRVISGSSPQSRADSMERPSFQRATTFEGPRQLRREHSPLPENTLTRVATNPQYVRDQKDALRPVAGNRRPGSDGGYDSTDTLSSSPGRFGENAPMMRVVSGMQQASLSAKKPPPPPPPSRTKKPPPPPPPMRRGISAGVATHDHY